MGDSKFSKKKVAMSSLQYERRKYTPLHNDTQLESTTVQDHLPCYGALGVAFELVCIISNGVDCGNTRFEPGIPCAKRKSRECDKVS